MMVLVFLIERIMCHTWFQGIFQPMVIGPVLWVSLLQASVDFCGLVQTLQLQQQLSYRNTRGRAPVSKYTERVKRKMSDKCGFGKIHPITNQTRHLSVHFLWVDATSTEQLEDKGSPALLSMKLSDIMYKRQFMSTVILIQRSSSMWN